VVCVRARCCSFVLPLAVPAHRFFAAFLMLAGLAGGTARPSAAQTGSGKDAPLTLAPERPRPGRPVTVTYDAQAEGARLRAPGALELVVRTQRPDYRVRSMKKDGARWTARLTPDSSARFLRLYVQSDSAQDRNGGAVGWGRMLYGPGGSPVRGAHVARADFLREHRENVPDSLLAEAYRRERALHPDHLVAKAHLRALQAEGADDARADSLRTAAVLGEIDAARQRHADDPKKLREVQRAYYALGRRGKARSVGATLMQEDEEGPEARLAAFRRATAEGQRPARTRRRVEAFLERFPNSFFEGDLYESLFKKYRDAGLADSAHVDSMRWAGRRWVAAERVNPARAHGQLARALAEAGRYDAGAKHARQAIQVVRSQTPTEYSFFKTASGWDWAPAPRTPAKRRRQARRQRGKHRAVLGRIHLRRKDYAKAAAVLARAARERPGDGSIWRALAKAREQAGRPKRAFAAAEEAVRRAPMQRANRALFRRHYRRRHGSTSGLRDTVVRLARPALLAERLGRPAPPIRLTRLDSSGAPGRTAGDSLRRPEALEGKVLVLDFWASWCAPCREAFPHLQAAYERYRDAPDVRFLAVNTSWNETKARARRFIEQAGYTFPLYWDAGGRLARAFGIRSIPATVLIGKGGRVQYRQSGFGGPQQYTENLALRIELLRSL
jgi:thiol-disulfide isomerase/thioredoxin